MYSHIYNAHSHGHGEVGLFPVLDKRVVVAILGFPNVGKSSLFNILTGASARVANWPGTTVEINYARISYNGVEITLVDLPGIYSLSEGTTTANIVKSFLLEHKPNVLLVLVDSENVQRSLGLAVQLLEYTSNVVIALTKIDRAHGRGVHINVEGLSRSLRARVIPTSIVWSMGLKDVMKAVVEAYESKPGEPLRVDYGVLESYISIIQRELEKAGLHEEYNSRWLSIKLLEGDPDIERMLEERGYKSLVKLAEDLRMEFKASTGRIPLDVIVEARFKLTSAIASGNVIRSSLRMDTRGFRYSRVDRVFLDARLAPLASITLIFLVFTLLFTINTGFPLNIIVEELGFESLARVIEGYSVAGIMERFTEWASTIIDKTIVGYPSWVKGLIVDGVMGGLGLALFFIPLIFTVSVALAVLEDSGLAPRIAVGMHSYTCKLGLSGHTMFPALTCFGCNVAGIAALKGVPNHWERFKMYLLAPLLPCQARLLIFIVFASALTGLLGITSLVLVYVVAIAVLLLLSNAIDRFVKGGFRPELLLEIPSIHRPIARVTWWLTWSRIREYIERAAIIIFLGALITWIITHTTPTLGYTEEISESIAASLTKHIAPLLKPLGIPEDKGWLVAYSLLIGFIAKELYIAALVGATGIENPVEAVKSLELSNASLIALMTFIALYTPCLATVSITIGETRSYRIALLAVTLALLTAYTISTTVYVILNTINI